MASEQPGGPWRQLGGIFGAGTASGLSDPELLGRFARGRDEPAFAAIVGRHGPMVLATCRGVLRSADDAEDAFQATFLVLARKAGSIRVDGSLGGWLHRVARRVAARANADASRRRVRERDGLAVEATARGAGPWDDLVPILHEEIGRLPARYREPIVLCDLGALTRDEAAGQLGWPPGTVAGRLARARKLLRDRLARRGASPASLGPIAAVPTGWAEAAARAASAPATSSAAGIVSATAFLWSERVIRAMLLAKFQAAGAAVLALAATGLLAAGLHPRAEGQAPAGKPMAPAGPTPAGRVEPPGDFETYEIRGRVVDPEGRPVAGARVEHHARGETAAGPPATSDADGRFRLAARRPRTPGAVTLADGRVVTPMPEADPWGLVASAPGYALGFVATGPKPGDPVLVMARDDLPISGRVIDLQGRPVAGAVLRPLKLYDPAEAANGLKPWLDALAAARDFNGRLAAGNLLVGRLEGRGGALATLLPPARADAEGRVRLAGVGRERVVMASVEGPGIETKVVMIANRPGASLRVESYPPELRKIYSDPVDDGIVLGPGFDHVAGPGHPLKGVVNDRVTGKPIAGVRVVADRRTLFEFNEESRFGAVSDGEGLFRIEGLPVGALVPVTATPPADAPYPGEMRRVDIGRRSAPDNLDFPLRRGVWVTGRVLDRATGRPPANRDAQVTYHVFVDNPNIPANARPTGRVATAAPDGSYRLIAYPGRGLVSTRADTFRFVRGAGAGSIAGLDKAGMFRTHPYFFSPLNANTVAAVDPPVGAEGATADLYLESGGSRTGRVLDPEGRPISGVEVAGLEGMGRGTLDSPDFRVAKLVPGQIRRLTFRHDGRKLLGMIDVAEAEGPPLSVKLVPWATLSGRWVDEDGRPVAKGLSIQIRTDGKAMVQSLIKGGELYRPEHFRADADGRFRAEAIIPGQAYDIFPEYLEESVRAGSLARDLILKPGEDRDLGDVRLTPFP